MFNNLQFTEPEFIRSRNKPKIYIKTQIQNFTLSTLIDSGNLSLNLIDYRLYLSLCQNSPNPIEKSEDYDVVAANHTKLDLLGQVSKPLLVTVHPKSKEDPILEIKFRPFVARNLSCPLILNLATLTKIGAIINLPDQLLSIKTTTGLHHYPLMEKRPTKKEHPVYPQQ